MRSSIGTRAARFVAMLVISVIGVAPVGLVGTVAAQETPRSGGELVFVVPAEPPSFDTHREESFSLIHPAAPHYSTMLRVDLDDPSRTKIVGDLAESWSSAPNGRTWTFKICRGVKFHDDSELTARDVKASYHRIVFPPAGVASNRKGEYVVVEAVEAPAAATVVFRLKWPAASFLASLASPFNWIYKAEILARDIRWYEKNIMGSGPFVFGEYVKGSHWTGPEEPGLLGPRQALSRRLPRDLRPRDYSRYTDRTLDELYQRQSCTTDREERRRTIREFEKRLLDDEVHYIFTFQRHRIVPHNARLKGWTITPSHFLNNQLDTVWLAPE